MSAENVALIPECAECGAAWLPADEDRWEAFLTDDEPPELAFFCRPALLITADASDGSSVRRAATYSRVI